MEQQTDDPFIQEVNAIQSQLKTAIFDRNAQATDQLAQELRRYWVVALVRGYRDGFQVVNKALLSVASMAHSYADLDDPGDPLFLRYRIWEFLGEAGTMIQRIHTEWIAQERVEGLDGKEFEHERKILQYALECDGVVSFSGLVKHMREMFYKDHPHPVTEIEHYLRKLTCRGLVDRVGWGVYHLTIIGTDVAKLLNGEEK